MKEYERLTETEKINEYCSTVECGEHCEDCYAGKLYERLAELEDKIERGELVENTVVTYINMARSGSKTLVDKALKYDELKAKIKNGTLIELPCKVGDTVYIATPLWDIKKVVEAKVDYVEYSAGYNRKDYRFYLDHEYVLSKTNPNLIANRYIFRADEFFATKSEAEQKLKELRGKDETNE